MPKDITLAECFVNPSCETFDGYVADIVEVLDGPRFSKDVLTDMARFAVRKKCKQAIDVSKGNSAGSCVLETQTRIDEGAQYA